MKNVMRAFYSDVDRAKEVWESPNTLFIFDTNILRKLYSYAEQTREDFFALLEAVSDKIWIPYHVALEFQRGRLSAIKEEKAIFRHINKSLDDIETIFKKDIAKLDLTTRLPKLARNTDTLYKDITKLITNYKKSVDYWDKKQICVRSHDSIRDKIDILFENKVGQPPESQDWLNDIYSEGKNRFENKTPPGFKDANKEHSKEPYFEFSNLKYERQYSDLVIWKQIINHAKNENIENVIFVTNDLKEDWWYTIDSGGEKRIGHDARLKEEICKESDVKYFQIYDMIDFFKNAEQFLDIKINEESIQEAKQLQNTIISKEISKEEYPLYAFSKSLHKSLIHSLFNDDTNKSHNMNIINEISGLSKHYINEPLKHNTTKIHLSPNYISKLYTNGLISADEYIEIMLKYKFETIEDDDLKD
jgi:hypothetical protein